MSQAIQIVPPEVASVFITEELARRSSRAPDYFRETVALRDLSRQMADDPQKVLPRLVDIAIEMCGAVSGGISLYEPEPSPGVFRWHHLRGDLSKFTGATTPRNFSPCGITLDFRTPILVQRPERVYTWLQEAKVSLPECLLVPLYLGGEEPLGTLWIVSADEEHFHEAHSDAMKELAAFAGIALKMAANERRLRSARDGQAMLAREMDHRVKNLFALVEGLVNMSAKQQGSAADVAERICARLHALSAAHDLARGSATGAPRQSDLRALLQTILAPHQDSAVTLEGPDVRLGPSATNCFALVFHELATNAAKYGALGAGEASLSVTWSISAEQLSLCWSENVGSAAVDAPNSVGFGTLLAERTIAALGGKICFDWQRAGLVVEIEAPLANSSR